MRILQLFWLLLFTCSANATSDLKTINAEEFYAQNPSPERRKIIDFIVHQFDNKKDLKITQSQLDHIWNNEKNRKRFMMYRFQIIDQKLYADSYDPSVGDFRALFKYLQNFVQHYKVADVDFIMYRRDRVPEVFHNNSEEEAAKFPAIIMSKNIKSIYEKDKILLPDNFVAHKSWGPLTEEIIIANNNFPWDQKIEKIFWRGATSNGTYDINNFDKLPRLTLVMLSKLYPELIDAKFSRITNQFPNTSGAKSMKKLLKILWSEEPEDVKEIDHLQYKYLVSIDGNTCAWARVPWIMLSNSVLLRQETDNMEWFYPAMEPYVHYIPLNENLTNIFDQVEWMKMHDQELQQVSKNAQNFALNNLMPEHIKAHIAIILNEYHKFHREEELLPTLKSFEEMTSLTMLIKVLYTQLKDGFLRWKDALEYDLMDI